MSVAVQKGAIYEHYKKQRYTVLALAKHADSEEELVVYQRVDEQGPVWVRSLAVFKERVLVEGALVPRFRLIE